MTGGSQPINEKVVPKMPYNNNPLKSFESQNLEQKYRGEFNQPQKSPTITLQYTQPPAPKTQQPPFGYVNPYYYNIHAPGPVVENKISNLPITKVYQFASNQPDDNIGRINAIFEDMFPENELTGGNLTLTTIKERTTILHFIRNIILSNSDGNDVKLTNQSLGGTNVKNMKVLSNYIKFDRINPYRYYDAYNKNIYKGLPYNFLIYNSCYPIRKPEHNVVCATNSTSVNIRIYAMSEESYSVIKQGNNTFHEFDEWRDINFYEDIREDIIKKNVCPNFIMLYGYFVSTQHVLDFNQVNKINQYNVQQYPTHRELKVPVLNSTNIVNAVRYGQYQGPYQQPIQLAFGQQGPQQQKQQQGPQTIKVPNPKAYLGKCLIALTEAPTYNILEWATIKYTTSGTTRQMINRGFHTVAVWYNVLFQLFAALYALLKHDICIKNFTLEKNVFIKDIPMHPKKYWIYKIDDVDYYLPNLGFLVLVDSHFRVKDTPAVKTTQSLQQVPQQQTPPQISNTRDINSKNINTHGNKSEREKTNIDMFRKAFNPDNFSQQFKNKMGVEPEAEVLSSLQTVHTHFTDLSSKITKWDNIISAGSTPPTQAQTAAISERANALKYPIYFDDNFIFKYVHSKVGTEWSKIDAMPSLTAVQAAEYRVGKLYVYELPNSNNTPVIWIGIPNADATKYSLLTMDQNNKYIIQENNKLNMPNTSSVLNSLPHTKPLYSFEPGDCEAVYKIV
jgi:hypothetical protein